MRILSTLTVTLPLFFIAQTATAETLGEKWARFNAYVATAGQDHMSPIGMYMAADVVVKSVMLALIFASLLTWAIFAAKLLSLGVARLRLQQSYRQLDTDATLRGAAPDGRGAMPAMIAAALIERDRASADMPRDGIKDRAESALSRVEAGAARRMAAGTGLLANVGAVAPFVGLFGTVWGIMNSFISIANTNTTNLAVVAPGIAEALLATALGLVAAIPAVIFYNILSRAITGYRVMLTDAATLVQRTLSRDLDRAFTAQSTVEVE
ncbi:outer membrane transport energization protein ExbB [Pacificibacter maritimus]|uniref:Biopolymer transport protein ExbB n=1 Tax=Pacificibacter maritimus TaxID=762213 RepID=A0A3N4UBZ4_9RHOB|nr:tonB-system energizer ExbB [Pacificibacter maritimus]RPE67338.1 outer membrane transport energization protein ExbB [Pacificibacter maritimus]